MMKLDDVMPLLTELQLDQIGPHWNEIAEAQRAADVRNMVTWLRARQAQWFEAELAAPRKARGTWALPGGECKAIADELEWAVKGKVARG